MDFLEFQKKWEGKDLCPISANILISELREMFTSTIEVSQRRELEQNYFRVRTGKIEDITNPKEFSYPPAEFTGPGRCNIKNHPVFYCSESPNVALDEVGIVSGEECYLSLWSSGNNFPDYAQYIMTPQANSKRLRDHYDGRKDKVMQMEPLKTSMIFLRFLEFVTELFVSNSHTISSALSYNALYQGQFDGIEYLDAKAKKWYNFALRPSFAETLHLKAVFQVIRGDNNSIKFGSIGTVHDCQIKWQPYNDDLYNTIIGEMRFVNEEGNEIQT